MIPLDGPRTARTIAVAALSAFVGVYVVGAFGRPGAVALVPLELAVLASLLPHVVPGLARFRRWWLPVAQTGAAAVAVAGFGGPVGLLGVAAGALLLGSRWWASALVVAAGVGVAAARAASVAGALDAAGTVVLAALATYGLCALTERVEAAGAARLTRALTAVREERLRVATLLEASIGRALEALARPGDAAAALPVARSALSTAREAAADLRSLSLAPEIATARSLLAAAGVEVAVDVRHAEPLGQAGALLATVLREAVTDVVRLGTARRCVIETDEQGGLLTLRVISDGVPTAARGAEALEDVRRRLAAAGGRLDTGLDAGGRFRVAASVQVTAVPRPRPSAERRMSLALLGVVLVGLSLRGLLQVPPSRLWIAVPALAVVCGAQFLWTRPRVRHWPWFLGAQAVLSYLPMPWLGGAWAPVPGFLLGSLLLLFGAAAWPVAVLVVASVGVLAPVLGADAATTANAMVSALVTGLIVYGMASLARLSDELRAAGADLARSAVVSERLRAARDLHDLLGQSLTAILLKAELARRLPPDRAGAELADIAAMAERARADMATVAGEAPRLELAKEVETARSILAAAGIEVTVTVAGDPPDEAQPVLAVVLREAVTNVLRHSAATRCAVEVSAAGLTVRNDGVSGAVTPPGSGLGNLATRLSAVDAALTAGPAGDGGFVLTAALRPAP
ncbi:sensor histidine kinase [Actinomadura kijaniata]|uniref:sensor histidine kinase n=1 Tax=Actinomadura kijaniata TaxID=46161 RepID=UPI000ACCEA1D|nr:histidine kinase [Actinomadura kijaniata]